MSFSIWDLAIVTTAAAAIGGVSGFFGVGGAFLLVPVLNIALGIPVELAVGVCACQILGLATTSILARRIDITQLKLPLILSGGLFCGVLAGARGLRWADSLGRTTWWGRDFEVSAALVLSLYCLLLTSLGFLCLKLSRRTDLSSRTGDRVFWLSIPPYTEIDESGPVSIVGLTWLGLVIGGLSGLLGISGGLILLPTLTYLVGMRTHEAVVASLVIVWITTAQATAVHAWNGNVDLALAAALLLGGTFGARIGSEVGLRARGAQFRRWFAYLLLLTAVLCAARLVWIFRADA